jgi:hypothetical protein
VLGLILTSRVLHKIKTFSDQLLAISSTNKLRAPIT